MGERKGAEKKANEGSTSYKRGPSGSDKQSKRLINDEGVVLSQEQDGERRVVAFANRHLRSLPTTPREIDSVNDLIIRHMIY